ncbi:MAG: glutamine synthetase [Candidatus Atribacteria bacterium]|nr:glutamine synthetase [Candidatus Atribacteria bacterium]
MRDIIKEVEENKIDVIWLQFVDILGFPKLVEISPKMLRRALDEGVAFDGSSIEGFARIEESDMLLKPNPETFTVLPWTLNNDIKIGKMICDVYVNNNTPFEGDPRFRLRKIVKEAEEKGFIMQNGAEEEFFLFKLKDNKPSTEIVSNGSYFEMLPEDVGEKTRSLIAKNLEDMGYEIEASHHEVSPSQHEIDFKYADPITTADRIVTFKIVAKTIALLNGLYATFMPKPIFGVNGSGAHTNISLIDKNGKNLFFDKSKEFELSDIARYFIGGIFKHINAITAIANPTINSYKRIVPGFEAPVYISWAVRNRSALIRVPQATEKTKRIEFRSPDPTANTYLLFAVVLKAGLDGIEHKIDPGAPANDINIFEENEKHPNKFKTLPSTLKDAIEALKKDDVIKDCLGESIYKKYIEAKENEWDEYRISVTDWEIKNLLHLY